MTAEPQPLEVLHELNASVNELTVELQRLNNNLQKLQGQQEVTANICTVMGEWMDKSPLIRGLLKKQSLPLVEQPDKPT